MVCEEEALDFLHFGFHGHQVVVPIIISQSKFNVQNFTNRLVPTSRLFILEFISDAFLEMLPKFLSHGLDVHLLRQPTIKLLGLISDFQLLFNEFSIWQISYLYGEMSDLDCLFFEKFVESLFEVEEAIN